MAASRYNGAYYYSIEICERLIPNISTSRNWVTVNVPGCAADDSIVFIHNNLHPENYEWLRAYKNLVLLCGIPDTVEKVAHLGHAAYLPLSVDVAEVQRHARRKDRQIAYAGRPSKRLGMSFDTEPDAIEGLPRHQFLDELARYRQVYAVGRTAIEAKVLGCEVLPYDPRFPYPDIWEVRDTLDVVPVLQSILDDVDGEAHAIKQPALSELEG